ncbi:sigma-70 family RNA polymerase sigma factor [Clostridium sp. Marseille-P299]|uniref:sigma-70 family RNA polymerase sigma factor n=1 Tax=Clostridium sp. Marseille-P299 TaxID=1805477 RepID=UPI00082D7D3A|nr:sigma-70 family RNA polymerase sigma factor [Clostridium sp. Marseille-P299]
MNDHEFTMRIEDLKTRLYRTAFLYLGSESMAIDAVDEAVYKGLKGVKKLREPEYFNTWMTRILINECKMELRRRKKEQPLSEYQENVAIEYDSLELKEAIGCLPQELKEVVILRYFAGYTLSEAAESLQIPQGTVVTRQRRALQYLRLELLEEKS